MQPLLIPKTTNVKPDQVERRWYVVDASGMIVGRLAAEIARILMGKHKPYYTPHVDCGDYVVVVNADKVVFTGKKLDTKMYKRYTGYPGGLRETPAREMLRRKPEQVIELAVRRMLPKNKLARRQLRKLKVYAGPDHPHAAQRPEPLTFPHCLAHGEEE